MELTTPDEWTSAVAGFLHRGEEYPPPVDWSKQDRSIAWFCLAKHNKYLQLWDQVMTRMPRKLVQPAEARELLDSCYRKCNGNHQR